MTKLLKMHDFLDKDLTSGDEVLIFSAMETIWHSIWPKEAAKLEGRKEVLTGRLVDYKVPSLDLESTDSTEDEGPNPKKVGDYLDSNHLVQFMIFQIGKVGSQSRGED